MSGNLSKIFISGLILALFVVFFVGPQLNLMPDMGDCPMTHGQSSLCPMTALQHIDKWGLAFNNILPDLSSLFLILIFLAVALVSSFRPKFLNLTHLRFRQYLLHCRELKLFNPLTRIYSQGLIQTILYA